MPNSSYPTLPSWYIPHGGGPCFFMEWTMGPRDTWDKMKAWMEQLGSTLPVRPKAILLVSAHWEEREFTVTGAAQPGLIYDYYGFPPHTYQLTYPAAGDPALATQVVKLLHDAGIVASIDPERGFDHGVFIPLKVIYPDAEIPVVQLSLKKGLNPSEHIKAGQALQSLRDEGVLIIGSGMSYHNMRGFSPSFKPASDAFDAWLKDVMRKSPDQRNIALTDWQHAPSARICHPREEHLLPLMVIAGASGKDVGACLFTDCVMEVTVSAFSVG